MKNYSMPLLYKTTKSYTYIYLDPRKPGKYQYPGANISFLFEPFYIGKGTKFRAYMHLSESHLLSDKNKLKTNKIRKIIKMHKDIRSFVLIIFKDSPADAISTEIELISKIGRINVETGPLTNLTLGGDTQPHGNNNPVSFYYLVHNKGMSEIEAKQFLRAKGQKGADNRKQDYGADNASSKFYKIISPNKEVHFIACTINAAKFLNVTTSTINYQVNKGPIQRSKTVNGKNINNWEIIMISKQIYSESSGL
jgi:hypothetical protein